MKNKYCYNTVCLVAAQSKNNW